MTGVQTCALPICFLDRDARSVSDALGRLRATGSVVRARDGAMRMGVGVLATVGVGGAQGALAVGPVVRAQRCHSVSLLPRVDARAARDVCTYLFLGLIV